MFNAAQAKVKLIARIFAETGIRDLFSLLHMTIRKNGSQAQTVRLRNQWVRVDPRDWRSRSDMTINVGLGTGSKSEQLAHMMTILGLQKEALAGGFTNLVDAEKIYNAAKEVTKLVGLKDATRFFNDPEGQSAPQTKQDPKLIELQMKNEIEKTQAQADMATNNQKVRPTSPWRTGNSNTTHGSICNALNWNDKSNCWSWKSSARTMRSTWPQAGNHAMSMRQAHDKGRSLRRPIAPKNRSTTCATLFRSSRRRRARPPFRSRRYAAMLSSPEIRPRFD